MATHTIQIIYTPKKELGLEKHSHKVRPGHLYVSNGDEVIFLSNKTDMQIFLPPLTKTLLQTDNNVITIHKGKTREFTIMDPKTEDSRFPYAVYCLEGNDFAEGGSVPQMIVRK